MTIERSWLELEELTASSGTLKRLLDPYWVGELYAAVQKPDNRPALLLILSEPVIVDRDSIAKNTALTVSTVNDPNGGISEIQVTLDDLKYKDQFGILCNDLVRRVHSTKSEKDGAQLLLKRLRTWLQFLRAGHDKALSDNKQMALFGELRVMEGIIAPVVGFRQAVRGWRGPFKANQDFQLNSVAAEVKTLASPPPHRFSIENERQLDDSGVEQLLLIHLAVDRKPGVGRSLRQMVESIRQALDDDDEPAEEFEEALYMYGYLEIHAHLYAQEGYLERSIEIYHVANDFPRLTASHLPIGVGDASYKLDASACEAFRVEPAIADTWLKEATSSQ